MCSDDGMANATDKTHEGCERNNGGCSHTCTDDASGVSHCSCPAGYQLDSRGLTCLDIDECLSVVTCSQVCTNVPGSHYCSCAHGFTLRQDGRGCKADNSGGVYMYIMDVHCTLGVLICIRCCKVSK